jgi:hypothetical protein
MYTVNFCINCSSQDIFKKLAYIAPFVSNRMYGLSLEKDVIGNKEIFPFIYTNSIRCNVCSFIFSQIRPNDQEMKTYYKNYFEVEYNDNRCIFEKKEPLRTFKAGFSQK